jgi:hypothetical protein
MSETQPYLTQASITPQDNVVYELRLKPEFLLEIKGEISIIFPELSPTTLQISGP